MDYIGEHLLPGQLGRFFIVLSLVASLVATVSYFLSTTAKQPSDAANWKRLARFSFITEVISVLAVFSILFYIIHNHLFEYKYAWQHSSLSLEFKYLLACFWEGQEGSFLLWSIWHCVLGIVIIKSSKEWEAPVMTVISFAQFALATMIAGLYIFGHKIGSNPFLLLRESGFFDDAAEMHVEGILSNPVRYDYLSLPFMRDGNDLNPLLQNKWMVIHPPVLFLGFASTIVPFAFAIAGLWKKKFAEWVNHALPWALFSAAVLGVGIMMGAWWAYESLTFGGYWAWDPVENASLVPWLILIAGIHTALIFKHSGHSLRSTHLFYILSFGFVLYSTFLTRSGILGDTSVHAFTDLGMNTQLYLLLYFFIWGGAILAAKDFRQQITASVTAAVLLIIVGSIPAGIILGLLSLLTGLGFLIYQIQTQVPTIHKEESGSSREFWMFIGALVFFLSSIVIIGKTSLPVLNKVLESFQDMFPSVGLFKKRIANPEDAEFAYNSIQVYVAIIIGLLTAVVQYFKYKSTPAAFFWKKILVPTAIAMVVATAVLLWGDVNYDKQGPMFQGAIWLAVVCSIYAIIANAGYIWIGMKGKLKVSGGSISHLGFGMVLVGILLSSSKKEMLSRNTSGIYVPFGKESKEKPGENLTLVKGQKMDMGKYWVTYTSDSAHPKKQLWFYNIQFERKDGKESFTLRPNAFINYKGNEGLMANPDSRHYLDHDVFTYITSLPDPSKRKEDTTTFKPNSLKVGDSLFYSKGFMMLEEVDSKDSIPKELFGDDGQLHQATLKIYAKSGSTYTIAPQLAFAKGNYLAFPDTITAESMVVRLQKVNPDNSIELGIKESDNILDYVTLKAYKFPMINLLWLGVGVTALGILMSMVNRIGQNRRRRSENITS